MAEEQTTTGELIFSPDKLLRLMRRKNISPAALVKQIGCEPRQFGKRLLAAGAEDRTRLSEGLRQVRASTGSE